MNCVVASVAHVLGISKHNVYIGIGHGEPIHMAEVVAYLLTQGYGALPFIKLEFDLLNHACLIEGHQEDGTPHMIAIDTQDKIYDSCPKGVFIPELWWFLVPTKINVDYCAAHARKRDAWRLANDPLCVS